MFTRQKCLILATSGGIPGVENMAWFSLSGVQGPRIHGKLESRRRAIKSRKRVFLELEAAEGWHDIQESFSPDINSVF